jgi:hypothetical protein
MSGSGACEMKHFALLIILPFTSGQVDTYTHAPVYVFSGDAFVLERAGDFAYKPKEGYPVLYCVAESKDDVTLECVVHTKNDRLVLIEVQATGGSV